MKLCNLSDVGNPRKSGTHWEEHKRQTYEIRMKANTS